MWCVPTATLTYERQRPLPRVDTSSASRAIARCPTSIVKTTLASRLPVPLLRLPPSDGHCGDLRAVLELFPPRHGGLRHSLHQALSQFCQRLSSVTVGSGSFVFGLGECNQLNVVLNKAYVGEVFRDYRLTDFSQTPESQSTESERSEILKLNLQR